MKIGYYAPFWPPESGANGIVTYLGEIIPALEGLGHEITVLTPQHVKRHNLLRRALFRLSPTDGLYSALAEALTLQITELVKNSQIDILEIEESFGLAHAVTSLNKFPVCVRLHGPWFLNKRSDDKRRETLEGRALRSAAAISSPSLKVLEATKARYSRVAPSQTIPNPIKTPVQAWAPTDLQSILFVGRFDRIKGADLAVKAFSLLASEFPDLKMTMVGPDDGIDGQNASQYVLRELAPHALARFSFLGALSPNKIAELRLSHSMCVSCSRHEVMPYSVLESMALGCPIIASDVGGIPEMIASGTNGLLFPSESIDDFTKSIRVLLHDPKKAARLGLQARLDAAKYDPHVIAVRSTALYQESIDRFEGRILLSRGVERFFPKGRI
jgi:glycosyltransferase involved in cell wall biosynthesis